MAKNKPTVFPCPHQNALIHAFTRVCPNISNAKDNPENYKLLLERRNKLQVVKDFGLPPTKGKNGCGNWTKSQWDDYVRKILNSELTPQEEKKDMKTLEDFFVLMQGSLDIVFSCSESKNMVKILRAHLANLEPTWKYFEAQEQDALHLIEFEEVDAQQIVQWLKKVRLKRRELAEEKEKYQKLIGLLNRRECTANQLRKIFFAQLTSDGYKLRTHLPFEIPLTICRTGMERFAETL